jgi:hypothetical protein
LNSIAKYQRGSAKVVNCGADPCTTYRENNSINNYFNMGSLTLSIAGSSSVEKSLNIFSNTTDTQLFDATWLIGDNLFSDAPTSESGWTAFKSTYVTVGTGDNNINVDLAQWAADNGSVAGGALHSYTISSLCANSDGCKSITSYNTIEVEAYAPKTYVIVASGESTVVGRSNDKTTPPDTTDSRITQWGRISPNDGVEILADDPLQHNDTAQASNSIGMTMSYARALLPTLNSSDKIIIVPVARGGSGYYNNEHGIGNVLFTDTVARVNAVIALNPNYTIVKMITGLGINDGFYNASSTFQASFDADDANYRAAFTGDQSQMLHLVMGILPAYIAVGNEIPQVQAILQDSGNRLFNTVYVQWDDGLPISGSDAHPNGASNRIMGARLQTFDAAFTPVTPYAPTTAPANLTVTDGAEALTVSFDAVDFANSYVIQYKLSTDTTYTDIVTTSTSTVISSLTASVSYDVRVKARNLVGDSAVSAVVTGTPTAASVREVGADIHHFFGTDYATYEDIQGGGALTLTNTAPTNGTGETTTAAGVNGLKSSVLIDRISQTVIVVVKIDNSTGGSFVGGNITPSAGDGGAGFYEYNGSAAVQFRGTAAGGALTASPDYTDYVFLAFTNDGSTHHGYYQDSNAQKVYNSYIGSVDSSVKVLGVGNCYSTNANFQLGTSIAEFIIFDHPKTETELDDIYARSVTRLAARGITV